MYNEGVSREGEIIDLGVEFDVVQKSGSWYQYKEQRLGQGKEASKTFLRENPKMTDEIEAMIKKSATPQVTKKEA